MKSHNQILGKPIEFGNKEQIRILHNASEPHMIDPTDRQWQCVCCGRQNRLSGGGDFEGWIKTPVISTCPECDLRVLFYRNDEDGFEEMYLRRYLGRNEKVNLKKLR